MDLWSEDEDPTCFAARSKKKKKKKIPSYSYKIPSSFAKGRENGQKFLMFRLLWH